MNYFYGCIIGMVRYLEGVSWGYSIHLMHRELDKDSLKGLKLLFNLLLRLKKMFLAHSGLENLIDLNYIRVDLASSS